MNSDELAIDIWDNEGGAIWNDVPYTEIVSTPTSAADDRSADFDCEPAVTT